jgi:hypothetical protein
MPKVTPENRDAIRSYELVKAGIIPPFNPETTPAKTLDRLAVIHGCVVRAEMQMLDELKGKRGS